MLDSSRELLHRALLGDTAGAPPESVKLLEEIVARQMPEIEAAVERIIEAERTAGGEGR